MVWCDANVNKRVQVKQTYLDIFHTIFLQCLGRALAQLADAFGANAGVKLVFDLQQIGIELFPVRAVAHPEFPIKRVWRANGGLQCLGVLAQGIEADVQFGLGAVLVAQVAHAQAGGMGPEPGAGDQHRQIRLVPLQERFTNGG